MEAKLEIKFTIDQFDDIERVLYILVDEGWTLFDRLEYTQNTIITSIKLVLIRKLWE